MQDQNISDHKTFTDVKRKVKFMGISMVNNTHFQIIFDVIHYKFELDQEGNQVLDEQGNPKEIVTLEIKNKKCIFTANDNTLVNTVTGMFLSQDELNLYLQAKENIENEDPLTEEQQEVLDNSIGQYQFFEAQVTPIILGEIARGEAMNRFDEPINGISVKEI